MANSDIKLVFCHGGKFVNEGSFKYEFGQTSTLKIDPDKWSYFEVLSILKEMGYMNVKELWHSVGGGSMLEGRCMSTSQHFHIEWAISPLVVHMVSQPKYGHMLAYEVEPKVERHSAETEVEREGGESQVETEVSEPEVERDQEEEADGAVLGEGDNDVGVEAEGEGDDDGVVLGVGDNDVGVDVEGKGEDDGVVLGRGEGEDEYDVRSWNGSKEDVLNEDHLVEVSVHGDDVEDDLCEGSEQVEVGGPSGSSTSFQHSIMEILGFSQCLKVWKNINEKWGHTSLKKKISHKLLRLLIREALKTINRRDSVDHKRTLDILTFSFDISECDLCVKAPRTPQEDSGDISWKSFLRRKSFLHSWCSSIDQDFYQSLERLLLSYWDYRRLQKRGYLASDLCVPAYTLVRGLERNFVVKTLTIIVHLLPDCGRTLDVGIEAEPIAEEGILAASLTGLLPIFWFWVREKIYIFDVEAYYRFGWVFLKGKYGGELLTALGRNSNDQMLPLACVVMEVENKETLTWILEWLIDDLGGVRRTSTISDNFMVDIDKVDCTWRKWTIIGILCSHAMTAMTFLNINGEDYIHIGLEDKVELARDVGYVDNLEIKEIL
ncbi:hypothetical protein V8G54_009570 [Vigna mungo]|uniref:SWIM-type domain-containing protein n=1 Tax=Vigna mungo TaxID=3915 RepID=A0AAQ3NW20_VIGMU